MQMVSRSWKVRDMDFLWSFQEKWRTSKIFTLVQCCLSGTFEHQNCKIIQATKFMLIFIRNRWTNIILNQFWVPCDEQISWIDLNIPCQRYWNFSEESNFAITAHVGPIHWPFGQHNFHEDICSNLSSIWLTWGQDPRLKRLKVGIVSVRETKYRTEHCRRESMFWRNVQKSWWFWATESVLW